MARNSDMAHACDLYRIAYDLASRALEAAALDVLNTNPGLTGFCAAMGTTCFYDENGPVSEDYGTATRKELDRVASFEKHVDAPFRDMFGPCYNPVRLTRTPEGITRQTDW